MNKLIQLALILLGTFIALAWWSSLFKSATVGYTVGIGIILSGLFLLKQR